LLDQKVPKNQGSITMLAFLSQRYLPAMQGRKEHNKSVQFTLLCIATHMPCLQQAGIRTYLRLRTAGAFYKACPFYESFLLWQHCGTTVWLFILKTGYISTFIKYQILCLLPQSGRKIPDSKFQARFMSKSCLPTLRKVLAIWVL